jgi:hypothetical protein
MSSKISESSSTTIDIEDLNHSCGFKRAELIDKTEDCQNSVVSLM